MAMSRIVRLLAEQLLKRRFQVSLIMNQQRVLAEKPCVQRFGLEAGPVAAEQQTATDHVDRSANDCRSRGICRPLSIVFELPTQCADGQWRLAPLDRAPLTQDVKQACAPKISPYLFHFVGCLIHHGPAVYDVDQSAGYPLASASECEYPYCNHCRLAQSRRQAARGRKLTLGKPLVVQVNLPGKRPVPRQRLKPRLKCFVRHWRVLTSHKIRLRSRSLM
jgi:hypothetical protein